MFHTIKIILFFLMIFMFIRYSKYNYNNCIIFGIISKLSVNLTKNFFKSLIKVKYSGKVIIFVDKKENCKYYSSLDIHYIYYTNSFPYYPVNDEKYPVDVKFIKNIYPELYKIKNYVKFIIILRFYLIYTFIIFYGCNNDTYLLTDIRDVIFQRNPFYWNYSKGIYLIEESKIKKLNEAIFKWMEVYTTDQTILNNTIINVGIIFGTSNEIKLFLHDYIAGYKNERKWGYEQAYINYMYYSRRKFNYPIYFCESNKCFAKCIVQEIRFSNSSLIDESDMIIYNLDGSIPSIIHQYTYVYSYPPLIRQELFRKYIKIRTN